ncbi:hypothetical protein DWB77_07101 [Streptomyces hundungensis]|uniref:Uncharacterized protein n=1 Tax=Streptomyces hundungensis TaxID=1077946 RepID=A0A387HLU9_9ACTN|nr:hypothetical protein DWB77_07101 [Streptomyces hundungensis]
MTRFLDWLGAVTAAVSAVHALVVLLHACWDGRRARAGTAPVAPLAPAARCGCPPAVAIVHVEAAPDRTVAVMVRVAPTTGGARPWVEERSPW